MSQYCSEVILWSLLALGTVYTSCCLCYQNKFWAHCSIEHSTMTQKQDFAQLDSEYKTAMKSGTTADINTYNTDLAALKKKYPVMLNMSTPIPTLKLSLLGKSNEGPAPSDANNNNNNPDVTGNPGDAMSLGPTNMSGLELGTTTDDQRNSGMLNDYIPTDPADPTPSSGVPTWVYVGGVGLLGLVVAVLVVKGS